MKIKGTFIVRLWDGVEDFHFPNGEWLISRGHKIVAESIDQQEWSADISQLRQRLAAVKEGDFLAAESYFGGTGVEGQIIQRAGNYLLVEGIAWGSTKAAYFAPTRFIFETGTFDVAPLRAVYCGSLREFHREWVDRDLLRKIMERVYPEDIAESHASLANAA